VTTAEPLLGIDRLGLRLRAGGTDVPVLQDIDITVAAGEAVGVVGESGSGKSMTLRTVAGLRPTGATITGRVRFDGRDVLSLRRKQLRAYRMHDIAVIPQNPLAAINPLRRIGDFLTEAQVSTGTLDRSAAREKAVDALVSVGIPDAARRLEQYPHELSGGLLQRVTIAAALMTEPRLILADEPTTALDVTTQEEVIAILDERRREHGAALLLVTHDLDLAAAVTDRIVVVYAGVVVESAVSQDIHHRAMHPYTAGLLAARPTGVTAGRLPVIPGRPASAADAGTGCVFAARCPFSIDVCHRVRPDRVLVDGHAVACHRTVELPTPLAFPAREGVAS
jgi:oligopeptide/dipeptide ABC transporter ATP-binding protein